MHGDLKASNVLISRTGRALLSDFGISRRQGAGDGDPRGSLSALSPEQYLGRELDVRSDLFALGCLMYRMLSGSHPFMRAGHLDPRVLLEEPPVRLEERRSGVPDLPEGLADLVHSMIQKSPRDRPANTHQVRQALRGIAREVPLSAGNPVANEARALFRPESSADLPPSVPPELGREGRSRLVPPPHQRPWSWANPRARPRLVIAGLGILGVVGAVAGLAYQRWGAPPLRVHIEAPEVRMVAAAALPEQLSIALLVNEFTRALDNHLGPLLITGPMAATPVTTGYTRGRSPASAPPRERYQMAVRCSVDFCLLGLVRQGESRRHTGQAILRPEAPLVDWRSAVHRAAEQLFP